MKLYIGNIPYSATDADIRELLSDFNPIEDFFFPIDSHTNQPRGFAFVTLADREIGGEAIKRLDGANLNGRQLRVNEARQKTS